MTQPAKAELQNTIELQHATVELIALMQQFQYTKHLNTCKTQYAQHQQRKEKVTWNLQFHCAHNSRQSRRQNNDARDRRASEPTFLRSRTSVYTRRKHTMFRANPNIQIASMVQQFQCNLPRMTCKTNKNCKTVLQSRYLSTSVDATIPLRSADSELRHTIELQHTVEHIAWMKRFQCTKHLNTCKTQYAQHQQRKEKVTWNLQFHCAHNSRQSRRQNNDARDRRASEPIFLRSRTSVYTRRKHTMFRANPNIQIASMVQQFQCNLPRMTCKTNQNCKTVLQSRYLSTSVDATIPLRSADSELRHTIELQHTVEHIAWMKRFQYTKHLNTCKTQYAQHQQRKEKVTWNLQFHCPHNSRQIRRQNDDAQDRRASEPTFLRSRTSVYTRRKHTMFRANPNIQIASIMQQFQRDHLKSLEKRNRIATSSSRTHRTSSNAQSITSTSTSILLYLDLYLYSTSILLYLDLYFYSTSTLASADATLPYSS